MGLVVRGAVDCPDVVDGAVDCPDVVDGAVDCPGGHGRPLVHAG